MPITNTSLSGMGSVTSTAEIQAIMMETNNTENYLNEINFTKDSLSYLLKRNFSKYYSDYMQDPAKWWKQLNIKNVVQDIQKSIAQLYVITNSIQTKIDNLNRMVEYMESDMNHVKTANTNLNSEMIHYTNEKASSYQMVTDNMMNSKTEKYHLFFYIVGVCILLYFILHKILKVSWGDTALITAAANGALNKVAEKVNDKAAQLVENKTTKDAEDKKGIEKPIKPEKTVKKTNDTEGEENELD